MRNYNKSYKKKQEEVAEPVEQVEVAESEPVVEPEPVVEEQPVAESKLGVVTECLLLNVRKAPSADAEVVTTLELATEVMVDESESTDDFYKITTATSVEGFCMKKFIAV